MERRRGSLGFAMVAGVLVLGLAALSCGAKQRDFGTGGAGGSGSSSSTSATSSSSGPALSMIDDMEDMNGDILMIDGRVGIWYSYNDGTGTQIPPVDPNGMTPFPMSALMPPRGLSMYGAHTSGTSGMAVNSYAGISCDLNKKSGYDASKYTGVHFYAKIGAGASAAVHFSVGDVNTSPEGGKCMADCYDHFGKQLALTTDWTEQTIKFAEMAQVGWAGQNLPAIDKSSLYYVRFEVGTNVNFDIWVDDIAFYE